MDIRASTEDGVTVVTLAGELKWETAAEAKEKILEHAQPQGDMVLDMSGVSYMSSSGLRVLRMVYRSVRGQGGRIVLVGLSNDLHDTMQLTGFLDFFPHRKSVAEGISELKA